ncbi:hypothetical protein SNR26_14655 [Pectobacterium brasiliense]|uniref:hypothetical protein n=1 Tax=Pectobacterium brasiliense TaxID=180957 RepID=UPI002A827E28|nr:hypothetical protein [Pectobacterium brasiliense]MDY4368954.1 hypothetical protein [Pectobacterium brasiliense]MDY7058487.1 hypothetical protein [Pectobacterium brasiliense]
MNNFVKKFIAIEDFFNEETRSFITFVQRNGITWSKYELQEDNINQYYYRIRSLFVEYEPNLISLLCSNDGESRRVSLKIIKDGLFDFSSSDIFIEKLINISIIGNDEEKKLARNIIISRGWISARYDLIENIISDFYRNELDYYLYKDISEFLLITKNNILLDKHIKSGINSQDEDIIEFANELRVKLVSR